MLRLPCLPCSTLKPAQREMCKYSGRKASPLARMAHNLGSQPVVTGQWLFNIPRLEHFLMKLAPVFEQRLAQAGFSGLTHAPHH